jgi:cell division protease FtsH
LANLVNEATLLATRRNADLSRWPTSTTQIEAWSPGWRSATGCSTRSNGGVVAYHELGHAMVALALPGTDTVHKVSIILHGVGALGYTIQRRSRIVT